MVVCHAFDIATNFSEDVYVEYNWTCKAACVYISELILDENPVLPYYLNATVATAYDNLSSCWSIVV